MCYTGVLTALFVELVFCVCTFGLTTLFSLRVCGCQQQWREGISDRRERKNKNQEEGNGREIQRPKTLREKREMAGMSVRSESGVGTKGRGEPPKLSVRWQCAAASTNRTCNRCLHPHSHTQRERKQKQGGHTHTHTQTHGLQIFSRHLLPLLSKSYLTVLYWLAQAGGTRFCCHSPPKIRVQEKKKKESK